jgi:hypothetical protein
MSWVGLEIFDCCLNLTVVLALDQQGGCDCVLIEERFSDASSQCTVVIRSSGVVFLFAMQMQLNMECLGLHVPDHVRDGHHRGHM